MASVVVDHRNRKVMPHLHGHYFIGRACLLPASIKTSVQRQHSDSVLGAHLFLFSGPADVLEVVDFH